MTIVIDASATLAWLYQEKTRPGLFDVFRQVLREGAVVPTIWRYEIANSLNLSVRRGRINSGLRAAFVGLLSQINLQTDSDGDQHLLGGTIALAERNGLTVYDAAYLELALRRGLPLATIDERLGGAARAAGVELLP